MVVLMQTAMCFKCQIPFATDRNMLGFLFINLVSPSFVVTTYENSC